MNIFVSYRRADSPFLAGRVHDRLTVEFGEDSIFFDVDSMPAGSDFRDVLRDTLGAADVVIALIGPGWDIPRLHQANDVVRFELQEALQQCLVVIPVLVDGTPMPGPEDLPPSLVDLAFRHALRLRPDPDFRQDADRLVAGVRAALDRPRTSVTSPQRRPAHHDESIESVHKRADADRRSWDTEIEHRLRSDSVKKRLYEHLVLLDTYGTELRTELLSLVGEWLDETVPVDARLAMFLKPVRRKIQGSRTEFDGRRFVVQSFSYTLIEQGRDGSLVIYPQTSDIPLKLSADALGAEHFDYEVVPDENDGVDRFIDDYVDLLVGLGWDTASAGAR